MSKGLLEKFGSARVVDSPISELGFGGFGVGAAMAGLRPVIEMMTWNFAIFAMDQIVNSAAKFRHMSGGQLRCPIVFRGPNGAGGRLSSQHSQALEASDRMSQPGPRVSSVPEIHMRGPGWDMRSEAVDGMDVLAVHEKASELIEWIRAGHGPVLLEAFTYRFRGHSMSDAATYRTKEEVEYEKQRDPIIKLRQLLMDKGLANEAQLETIDEEQKIVVEKALAFADASPLPPDTDVWAQGLVEEGEADIKPRERVLGATDVKWPEFATDFKVTWDLEPKGEPAPTDGPRANAAKKGAA